MDNFFINGIFIGFVFGVPAGAIGALTIQRTLNYGFIAGVVTGLGSSVADIIYACIGVFGFTLIINTIQNYQIIISLIGCGILFVLGASMAKKKNPKLQTVKEEKKLFTFFSQSFFIAITNPATIFSFLIAFTSLGIPNKMNLYSGIQLILGILVGTLIWWIGLSAFVNRISNRITNNIFQRLNNIFAFSLFFFATVILIRTLKIIIF